MVRAERAMRASAKIDDENPDTFREYSKPLTALETFWAFGSQTLKEHINVVLCTRILG